MNFEDQLNNLGKGKGAKHKPPVQKVAPVEVPTTVVLQDKLKERLHKKAIKETVRRGQRVNMRELFVEAVEQKLLKHKNEPYKKGQEYKGDEYRTNYYISLDLNSRLHLFKLKNKIFLKQFFNESVHEYLKPESKTAHKQVTLDEAIQREDGEQ